MEYQSTTLRIPESLFHQVRIRAAIDKRSLTDIITEALTEWMRNHPFEMPSKKENV